MIRAALSFILLSINARVLSCSTTYVRIRGKVRLSNNASLAFNGRIVAGLSYRDDYVGSGKKLESTKLLR